jgi:hypothetical protein
MIFLNIRKQFDIDNFAIDNVTPARKNISGKWFMIARRRRAAEATRGR